MKQPTLGELESIEVELRLLYSRAGKVPFLVREAHKHRQTVESAWKNEALRFWYMVVRVNRNIRINSLDRVQGTSLLVDKDGKPIDTQQLMLDAGDTTFH